MPHPRLSRLRRLLPRRRTAVPATNNRALGYVFVMTYGRSGSTLLAGVLNTIPGYLIRGENRDALHHLFLFHQTLMAERRRVPHEQQLDATHPYFGIGGYPPRRALVRIRRLVLDTVLRPEPDTRVTGFKEIRWYHPDLEEYVAWLREVFPGARFVLNTRNHGDVLRSRWWARGDHAESLQDIEVRLRALVAELGAAAYHVHYDDYVADPTRLRDLFSWLGEDFDEAAVSATMAVRHSI